MNRPAAICRPLVSRTVRPHHCVDRDRWCFVYKSRSGSEVAVDAKGKWSITLSGLSPGSHVFAAKAIEGSTTVSNTVEVIVH